MEHQLSNADFFAIFASIFGLVLIFLAIAYVVTAIPTYFIGKKMGYDNPWFAFIPILNTLMMHDIAFGESTRKYFIIYFIGSLFLGVPYISWFIMIASVAYELYLLVIFYQTFKLPIPFIIMSVFPILSLVPLYMAAFGNYKYDGPLPHFADSYRK